MVDQNRRRSTVDFGFRISDFGFSAHPRDAGCSMLDAGSTNPPPACTFHSEPRFAASLSRRPSLRGPRMADRPAFFRHEEPGCARHVIRFLHRRHTTISLDCHLSLLPLGKSRRARPDVASRGRVGGGCGREKRSSTASCRSNVARRRAAGAQRWRSMASTRACSRRRPRPRTRGPEVWHSTRPSDHPAWIFPGCSSVSCILGSSRYARVYR